jgi:c-di-GMP-binding flagellar brake protein YcgR
VSTPAASLAAPATPSVLPSLSSQVSRETPSLLLSRTEIARVLSAIQTQRDPISIWQAGKEDEIGVANLLEVDPAGGTIDLTYTNSKDMNARLVRTRKFRCGGAYEGARFEFVGQIVKEVAAGDRVCLRAGFPDGLLFGQRRLHQRYRVPSEAGPMRIQIPLPTGGQVGAQIADVSLSGLGLIECGVDTPLAKGIDLPGCTLCFAGADPISVTLRVRHVSDSADTSGTRTRQIGCEFIAPPAALLALVKRFIVELSAEP